MYYINGTEVTEEVYDQDCEDNFNAGVIDEASFAIVNGVHCYYLTYDDSYGEA